VPAASSSVTGGNIATKATPATPGLTGASYREGTAAERPAAGVKGRIWYATDTKVYTVDSGSAWLELTQRSFGHTNIATEQTRTNVAFGTLTTPDEVEVTLPENGLLYLGFQATWKESVKSTANAAFFIGSNQLKGAAKNAPVVQESGAPGGTENTFVPLASSGNGLVTLEPGTGYTGDVTTGQIFGAGGASQLNGTMLAVFAAAGTYKVSVQYKSSSGTVTVKNRKLWVEARTF
jgi:hypothetical protein